MKRARFIVLTGVSGSGKKTALHALEDLGFFCVENLPAPLVSSFVDFLLQVSAEENNPQYKSKCFALLIDCRDEHAYSQAVEFKNKLKDSKIDFSLIFFDAQDDVLLRRFKETRRPHPFTLQDANILNTQEAIHKERGILSAFRAEADLLIDTTSYTPHQLRKRIEEYIGGETHFEVRLQSFGFKYGLPNDADLVVDVRFLSNPHFVEGLREKTGLDREVAEYVMAGEGAKDFLDKYLALLKFLIPRYKAEGKRSVTIAIGCTGGKHRSVCMVEKIKEGLSDSGFSLKALHRDVSP